MKYTRKLVGKTKRLIRKAVVKSPIVDILGLMIIVFIISLIRIFIILEEVENEH